MKRRQKLFGDHASPQGGFGLSTPEGRKEGRGERLATRDEGGNEIEQPADTMQVAALEGFSLQQKECAADQEGGPGELQL
jgi:hypothetical protein